eukprot:291582-Pyramimonas_sp.AAC.1
MRKLFPCVSSSAAREHSSTRLPAVAWLTVYRRIPVPRRALRQDELRGMGAQGGASWQTDLKG